MILSDYNMLASKLTTIFICYSLLALWWYCDGRFLFAYLTKCDAKFMAKEK